MFLESYGVYCLQYFQIKDIEYAPSGLSEIPLEINAKVMKITDEDIVN